MYQFSVFRSQHLFRVCKSNAHDLDENQNENSTYLTDFTGITVFKCVTILTISIGALCIQKFPLLFV